MIFTTGRSVARLRAQCLGGSRPLLSSTSERAPVLHKLLSSGNHAPSLAKPSLILPVLRRFYAEQAVSRPKAHTGRATTAGRKRATIAANATKKVAPKKSVSKATSKPKTKAKAKPKTKKKTKAKAKKPKRKVITAKQKVVKDRKARTTKTKGLKEKALLDGPNAAPVSAYQVFITEQMALKSKDTKPNDYFKEMAARWKNITPEQLEHLNHVANQRTAAKRTAYMKWVESHTPDQVKEANNARKLLTKYRRVDKPKSRPTQLIKDDRLVRQRRSAYIFFYLGRHQSGDFKGLKASESASLAGREWKALSAADKKPFEEAADQDKQRYDQEKKTVYKN